MYRVYKDQPIKNAKHFNFDIYANSLAKIILNKENKTPFTIAINGKWGSGKTTLMKTLRNELDSSLPSAEIRKVKTVWFDAWKYSECDSMLAALVNEILEEMARRKLLDKLKAKILVGSEKIDVLKQMSDLAKILTLGNGPEFENWFRKTEYQNKLSFFDLFQSYMKTILQTFVLEGNKYTDNNGVLVIFIDDLDRCSPKNIVNVLESINLFLDLEGCFFVIGTDISIISNAIDSQYKGIKNFSGIDYIKKMIQLNFDLPMLNEGDIQEFMKNELKIDSELEPYFDIIVKGLKSNPREIIRFLNSLNLMRTLGESLNGIKYEEELLIKWSVLNFSSVDFIEEVKRSPHFLIKVQEISGIKVRNERDKYIQSLEDKKLKERCSYFSGNDRITSVLYHGRKKFTLENIDTYLFLSNIAPKEVQVEEVLFSDKSKTGFVTHLDSTYQEDADLFEADFRDAYLVKANFNRARLMKANLQGANLKEANLQGANLTVADLTEANLQEANLQEANLTGTKMQRANLQGANLTKAKLDRADLTEANLKGANFRDAEIRLAVLYNTLYDSDTLQSILNSNGWNLAICDGDLEKILKSLYKK